MVLTAYLAECLYGLKCVIVFLFFMGLITTPLIVLFTVDEYNLSLFDNSFLRRVRVLSVAAFILITVLLVFLHSDDVLKLMFG